jgi:putative redox protein
MDVKLTLLENMSFMGISDSGHEVKIDSGVESGGNDGGPRPMELMAMALGGCTAMDVISILRKKKQDVTSFDVQLHIERAEQHPKVFTSAIITYEVRGNQVDEAALLRAIELSATKYCPAQAMLAKAFPIELRYRISDPDGKPIKEGHFEPVLS